MGWEMMCNHLYNNLCKVAVVTLLLVLYYPVSANETSDENFGITVSHAPETGWNPNTPVPSNKTTVWLIFLTVGGILTISGAAFLKIKKVKTNALDISDEPAPEIKPKLAQQPQAASQAPLPEYQPAPHSTPTAPPGTKTIHQPAPALQPEKKPEPPPAVKIVAPIVEIHQPAPALQPEKKPEPPPAVKIVAPKPSEEDDDMLFKHLDLLRHLKNESEK
jgi:hypothetical protein